MSARVKWPKERWPEEAAWRASGKPLHTYARESELSRFALRNWTRCSKGKPGSQRKPAPGQRSSPR